MKPTKKLLQTSISLVMPVYNEAESIEDVVKNYSNVLTLFPNSEFVICEDGSTDGTKEILQRLKKKYRLTLYQSPTRLGAVRGFLNALSHGSKDIVWLSDSDNTHDPRDVLKLLPYMRTHDMVIGRKFPRYDPWFRLFASWCLNMVINILFGMHFHDSNSGFRLIRKPMLTKFVQRLGKFPACPMAEFTILASLNGYRMKEIPVTHYFRKGSSRAIQPKKIPSLAYGIMKEMLRIRFGIT